MSKDEAFRSWYSAYKGIKIESFAYDVWCAAWDCGRLCSDAKAIASDSASLNTPSSTICFCVNPILCDLNDKCMRNE
jgi:hypothetical protein